MTKLRLLAPACALIGLLCGCGGSQPAVQDAPAEASGALIATKIPITSLDQLPQHTYPIATSASELLQDDAAFAAFAAAVRADLENDLNRYQLDDTATLQDWYGALANLAILDGRWDRAVGYLDRVTALEEKEAARLTGGQTVRALAAAHAVLGRIPLPRRCAPSSASSSRSASIPCPGTWCRTPSRAARAAPSS